jgi:hypothetical protein
MRMPRPCASVIEVGIKLLQTLQWEDHIRLLTTWQTIPSDLFAPGRPRLRFTLVS